VATSSQIQALRAAKVIGERGTQVCLFRPQAEEGASIAPIWIVRIGAAFAPRWASAQQFIIGPGPEESRNRLDRKVLADIACNDPAGFAALAKRQKSQRGGFSS